MRANALLLPFLLAFALPAVADERAATPEADPLVRAQLEALDYGFEVDEDGDFKLLFDLEEGRSQLAYVISTTEEYGALQVREVWSPAYRSDDGDFPAALANRLLQASHTGKLGAWVRQDDIAVLVVKVPASATGAELDAAINYAIHVADEMEVELTGGKDAF
ncbi:hypothetical protein [Lysobacter sp. A3-1-A15]|uniref:hypothetical protein n=1 Tax=Novilysobacter viscosus TaxID=3098602 RepID=UPI002ED896B6